MSKNGEPNGWQVRRQGNNNYATYTIRNTPGTDDPAGAANSNDGQWHHYAGVWNGSAGVGTRLLYVDGVAYTLVGSGDTGPMTVLPSTSALVLGGRDNGGYGSISTASCLMCGMTTIRSRPMG